MAELMVPAIVNPVAENSVNTIGRQFGYLWNYRKNLSYLEKQVVELQSKINDMDRSVDAAERNAKEIGDQVKNWVFEAKGIIGQANKILEHKEKGKLRCRVGLCPNLVSRHRLGRKANKIVLEVADVITKVPIREVFFRPVGQERTILSTKGLFAFDSRKSIFDEIMKALQTEPMVGLYGFGGMGKTTLAKQVAKQAEEEMLFEEFVFASVTQKVDMKEIQGKLASMLDLELEESTVAERAKRIHQRLKGKKVLFILDDLWDELNLEEMGVPFGAEYMGCKILLTSRFGGVLTSMGTGKKFNLGALDEEETWRLFKDKDRDGVLKNSNFHDIGKEVAKRCQGLPVLIVTVAASLSKRPQLSAWNDALRQLKEMDNKQMHDIVNFAIESISYNHLKKTHKQLFLLCGIIGGDASIQEVLQYSWGLDLFDGESMTIQAARDRLHNLIFDLKESCLLLDNVDSRNSIKMHDVVRDVAISIGSKDLNMFSMKEHGVELNIWRKDDLKRCTSMVLRGCPNIPPTLECPLLELFVMSGRSGDSSSSIPESFFEKTVKLKVLGMSRLSFSVLPPSLSFLTNLQTLRVNYCGSLKNISIVGELKKLQILSIASWTIDELPSGIGQLSELRSLDVRGCYELKVIPAGLIQGLTRLEELYVTREFNRWEAEERVNGSVKTNASLRELKHLHNLSSLEVRARDDKFLLEDIHFEKLERYEIIVGDFDNLWWLDKIEVTRKFCVQLSSTSINHLPQGFKRLFERAECLWLGELRGFKNVTPTLDGDVSLNLKHHRIKKDYGIEYVVNVEDKQCKTVFPYLESLHLDNLVKLQKICNFPPMKGSFCNLTTMGVSNCNGLESLFSFSMATGLPRLQVIEVSDCHALEAIVAEKSIKDDDGVNINDGVPEEIEFAQLRTLTLKRLPKLKNFFCNGEMQNKSHKSQSPDLNTKDEEEELKSILPFFTKVSFPKLEKLELSEISNLTQIWSHQFQEISCSKLTSLSIEKCKSLKHVFPDHVVPSLNKLQDLSIQDCEEVETIIGDDKRPMVVFPYLESLHLGNLVKLQKICNFPPMKGSFCNLTTMGVSNCNGLETLFSFTMATGLPRLQVIEVSDCHALEAIVAEKSIKDDGGVNINDGVPEEIKFAQLRRLTLKRLPKLKNFFCNGEMQNKSHKSQSPNLNTKDEEEELKSILPFFTKVSFPGLEKLKLHGISSFKYLLTSSVAMGLVELKKLKVKDCVGMKHLVVADEEGETLNFPQLRKLSLLKLPNLTAIYSVMDSNDTQPPISKKEISCCNLTSLTIQTCKSLKHVFPAHVAPSLNKLEYLCIADCEEVETIIGDENYEELQEEIIKAAQHEHAAATFMFFKLEYLVLHKLPKVKCFYPRKHTIKCPVLTDLDVTDCGNLSVFDFLSFPPKEGDDQFEKVVSKLEDLSIGSTELKMIGDLYGHFPPHLFSSLERLEIVGSDVFPSEFLGIIHKQLKDFTVNNCSFQEIFPYEGEFTNHANDHTLFFPQLAWLHLHKLPELKYICKHEQKKSFMLNIFGRLEYIFVIECPLLTNLVQPSTTISGCEKMEKVIGDDDDELSRDDDNEIIFPSLLFLKLVKLPRLRSFCSSPNYTFNFPKLTYVTVRECPNMKTFCEGITTTPKLKKVNCEGGEKRWEGDLNTTIQKMFAEMEAKRLGTLLPSTSSSNHVEGNARVLELTELIPHNAIESRKGTETCEEVTEEEKDGDDGVKATAPGINDKGKGKEQMVAGGSVASSSKLSNHSEEFHERLIPSISSSDNQEAEIHDQTAEPTKEYQICNHVVNEISEQGTFTETRIATEVSEDGAEKSAKLEAQRLPSKVPTNLKLKKARNPIHGPNWFTNLKRTFFVLCLLGLFITGSLWVFSSFSDQGESPAAPILLEPFSLSKNQPHALDSPLFGSDQDVQGLTSTVESETTDPKKGSEIEIDEEVLQGVTLPDISDKALPSQLHPPISNTLQATSQQNDVQELRVTKHFVPLMSKVLEILQTRPLNHMRPEHVEFMEDASRELSHMNFPMDWLCPYMDKAKNCLSVAERTNAISEVELKIAEVESQLQALQESKRALEEENQVIAFSMDLEKPLYEE